MDFFLFQVFPYIVLTSFLLGVFLRLNYKPYTCRSQSTQLLRKRQLIIGSTLFHMGILIILIGHTFGLLIPISVFNAFGISHSMKQIAAITVGGVAGIMCAVGLILLLHRRLFDARIRANTSASDVLILLLLLFQLMLGMATIPVSMQHLDGHEMVKFMNWAQHVITFRGDAYEFVKDVAIIFKIHLVLGMFIFLILPFTKLIHFLSAPVGFLFRPYQIVRRKGC